MYNPETEVVFPTRAIGSLSNLRGKVWQDIVKQVQEFPVDSPEKTAFLLMMITSLIYFTRTTAHVSLENCLTIC